MYRFRISMKKKKETQRPAADNSASRHPPLQVSTPTPYERNYCNVQRLQQRFPLSASLGALPVIRMPFHPSLRSVVLTKSAETVRATNADRHPQMSRLSRPNPSSLASSPMYRIRLSITKRKARRPAADNGVSRQHVLARIPYLTAGRQWRSNPSSQPSSTM